VRVVVMGEKRFSETERNCYYTSLVFDNQTQEELGTDKVVVLLNEQQAIISALKKEIKELKEKLDDVLELTEFVGMISLRKAEIKSIVNR